MKSIHSAHVEKELLFTLSKDELERIYEDILDSLPSKAPIYLPTEKFNIVDKIIGARHVRQIYKTDLDEIYRPRLRKLREKYRNHSRCFLIGNGPSLNETDLNALKDEVTFAVNGFFLKSRDLGWFPTFYLVEDHLVAEDRAHWINKLRGPIKLFPAYLGYVFPKARDTIFYNHRPRKSYPKGFDFSLEADKITYTGCTVTFSMMQIAAYLGFKEINLIGVDASYEIPKDVEEGGEYSVGVLDMKSDDINHFDPNYFGKGFRWHDPQVNKMVEAYSEAKRTLSGTTQTIYNATVGGKLEVFERRDFKKIIPNAEKPAVVSQTNDALKKLKYPKLLILDMTAMGNGSATGEVKSALFNDWPSESFMQVASGGKNRLTLVKSKEEAGLYEINNIEQNAAHDIINKFAPDVILYRPVPDTSWLHSFSMRVIKEQGSPLATWLMDDWPSAVAKDDNRQWKLLSTDLSYLIEISKLRFSICSAMSHEFERRYGYQFKAFANGVNPVDWPALRHHEGHSLHIRYGGGLAENMTLKSLQRIVRVVEDLGKKGYKIKFDINTQKWWYQKYGELFEGFKHTTIETVYRTQEEYRKWLSEADVVVIAYNFDENTLRYVQYSMANKMPECLASGAVVLAHGPRKIATINYLESTNASIVVDEPSDQALASAVVNILENPAQRNKLAYKARELAFDRHNIIDLREEIRASIASITIPLQSHEKMISNSQYLEAKVRDSLSKIRDNKKLNLKDANRILRNGVYIDAFAGYLKLWKSIDNPTSPLAQIYAFSALYAWRKLSGSSKEITIEIIHDKFFDDQN